MKKTMFSMVVLLLTTTVFAQQARLDFQKDVTLSGSNYVAYPGPLQEKLTPAPAGYKPFYLSHYGRHGSRYLIGKDDYLKTYADFQKADSANMLTPLGLDVMRRVRLISEEAAERYGELTQRGAEQHKGIAHRMVAHFPEIFEGKTNVDAKSTTVIRCILSMENALHELLVMNPQLNITHDASQHDMYYMNFSDKKLRDQRMPEEVKAVYRAFVKKHHHYDRLMTELFKDTAWVNAHIDPSKLYHKLVKLAANVQSTELRHRLTLYDLFNEQENYDNWLVENAWWYINYGPSPLNGGNQPYSQRNLLRKIIQQADSCLAFAHPGATLRYGHDTMVMPLTCLLDLNGNGKQIDDLEKLADEGWYDYRIFPMACNIQFVFYRKGLNTKYPTLSEHPILVKVLLNENEATLPIPSETGPYYRWEAVKAYYLKKIEDYEQRIRLSH